MRSLCSWNIGHKLDAGMNVSWSNPVIKQLLHNMSENRDRSGDAAYTCKQALDDLPSQLNSYCIDGDDSTSYWIVQNMFEFGSHPLHLHNHDFNVRSFVHQA